MSHKTIVCAGNEYYFKNDSMNVNINVSDICNFSCSYCINTAAKEKGKRILDKKILEQFIKDLGERKREIIHFSVAGGEPLLYPHIDFLVKKVAETVSSRETVVSFATNGSRLKEKGEELYAAAGERVKLKFSISVHTEQIKPAAFARMIADFGHAPDICCKILMAPGKLRETQDVLAVLATHHIDTILSVVNFPAGKPYPYSEEETRFLQQHATVFRKLFFHEYTDGTAESFDRITRGLHPEKFNYRGMWCCAGRNTLRLAPDGTVSRCFGFLRLGEKFSLTTQRLRDIPELASPCVCPATFCSCLTFLRTPKWVKPEDAPAYLGRQER